MTKRFRILLVEDNKLDQMAFERFVEHENLPYDYIIAGSVAEAKASLAAEQFDAIVTDYLLGDGTAFDLFGEMENLPTVVITGSGDESIAVKAMKAGANDYLIKDIDGHYLTTLPVTVENAIRFKQIQDELELYRQYLEELVEERTFELTRANVKLVTEIVERKQAEELLQQAHDELEMRVEERTAELAKTNKALRVEIEERKQAEVALRTSEERLSMFMESATDSFTLWDSEFNLVEINPVGLGLLAANREDVLGKNMLELSSKIEETGRYDTYRTVLETGDPAFLEDRVPRSTLGDVHLTWKVFRVGDGLGMIASDITERKRTEEFVRAQRDLALAISTAFGLDETLRLCLETAIRISDMDGGGIYLVDGTTGALDLALYQDMPPDFVSSASHYEADSSNARLVMAGRPVYSEHLHLGVPLNEVQRREALRAIAILPVRHENQVIACLNVASHTLDEVPVFARTVLETIAAQIGSTVARVQMEEALRESEDKFAKAFHSGPNLMAITRLTDGNIVDVNSSYSSTTGYSREELVGSSTTELNLWLESEMRDSFVKAIREQGRAHNFEAPIRTKSGEMRFVLLAGEMVDLNGKPHLITIASDITERKQAEEALRESESLYHSLVESLPQNVFRKDMAGRFTFANRQFCKTQERALSEIIDKTDFDIHPPELAKKYLADDRYIIKTGEVFETVEAYQPLGKEELYVQVVKIPVYDAAGQAAGIQGIFWDITERKQVEKKLKEAELRYRTVADFTYDWESWENPDGTFRYVSPACERITGYSVKQFVDDPALFSAIIVSEDRDIWAGHRHDVAEAPGFHEVQFRIRRQDDKTAWIEHACRPVLDEQGEFLGYRASNRDITERKQMEEALQARSRELALLNSAGRAFVSSLELDQVLVTVLDQVRRIIEIVACSIWLVDPKSGDLLCREVASPKDDIVRGWRLAPGQGLVGWVIKHGESLNIPDVRTDQRHFKGVDKRTGLQLRSILGVPLQTKNGIFGVLQLVDEAENRFSPDDMRLAESLATLAAIAIENARLYTQTQQYAKTKTLLLQEVNHRVKNNLTAIVGMLYIEQRHVQQAGDRRSYATIMDDLVNRIKGLLTVHQMLSASDWSSLTLSELAQQVINSALQVLSPDKQVLVDVLAAVPVVVTPKTAHHLAIVINELATNVIKYVVSTKETAQITVRITPEPDGETLRIEFRDDGPGFPAEVLRSEGRNVGLYLIENTVRHSLRGEITLRNDNGAVVTIRFAKKME